jgi:hypothetical protein
MTLDESDLTKRLLYISHYKEREIKTAPRHFAIKTLEMRLHFCVTEANISNFIFKYFPQLTMTDESDLTKRLPYISHHKGTMTLDESDLTKRLLYISHDKERGIKIAPRHFAIIEKLRSLHGSSQL